MRYLFAAVVLLSSPATASSQALAEGGSGCNMLNTRCLADGSYDCKPGCPGCQWCC